MKHRNAHWIETSHDGLDAWIRLTRPMILLSGFKY